MQEKTVSEIIRTYVGDFVDDDTVYSKLANGVVLCKLAEQALPETIPFRNNATTTEDGKVILFVSIYIY